MAKLVAVTGGIGSGKTEACLAFTQLGVHVVDLDQIAHAMSAPGSPAMRSVQEVFGDDFFDINGNLLRSKLRELVFANPQALEQLNQIMHPAIRYEAIRQIADFQSAPYVIVAIPLLVESKADWHMLDHIVLIDCEPALQVARIMQRSNLSASMAQAMIAAQSSREARLAIADTIIENNGSLDSLRQYIEDFHKKYSKTC